MHRRELITGLGAAGMFGVAGAQATAGGNHIRGHNNCQRPVEEIAGQDSAKQPNTIT